MLWEVTAELRRAITSSFMVTYNLTKQTGKTPIKIQELNDYSSQLFPASSNGFFEMLQCHQEVSRGHFKHICAGVRLSSWSVSSLDDLSEVISKGEALSNIHAWYCIFKSSPRSHRKSLSISCMHLSFELCEKGKKTAYK